MKTILHSFAGGANDGIYPFSKLLNVNETFYGVTGQGGTGGSVNCYYGAGCGTVFSVTLGGVYKMLAAFGPSGYPTAGLTHISDTLYGVSNSAEGLIYSLPTSGGTITTVFAFPPPPPGTGLFASGYLAVDASGCLFGVTTEGGGSASCFQGCGTVYDLSPSDVLTTLGSFTAANAATPAAGVILYSGMLYGTTSSSNGAVFSATP